LLFSAEPEAEYWKGERFQHILNYVENNGRKTKLKQNKDKLNLILPGMLHIKLLWRTLKELAGNSLAVEKVGEREA